jgi:uridine kinase
LILEHLQDLLSGKEVQMPVYNFNLSKRENFYHVVKPGKLIIFEGILALYDKVNTLYYKYFHLESKKFNGYENICRH